MWVYANKIIQTEAKQTVVSPCDDHLMFEEKIICFNGYFHIQTLSTHLFSVFSSCRRLRLRRSTYSILDVWDYLGKWTSFAWIALRFSSGFCLVSFCFCPLKMFQWYNILSTSICPPAQAQWNWYISTWQSRHFDTKYSSWCFQVQSNTSGRGFGFYL